MALPQKSRSAPGLRAHHQGYNDRLVKVNANLFGELLVAGGAKSGAITYNGNNQIETLVLTIEQDGAELTKTYTFTYSGTTLTGFTVT
jgi:hypothetical protein